VLKWYLALTHCCSAGRDKTWSACSSRRRLQFSRCSITQTSQHPGALSDLWRSVLGPASSSALSCYQRQERNLETAQWYLISRFSTVCLQLIPNYSHLRRRRDSTAESSQLNCRRLPTDFGRKIGNWLIKQRLFGPGAPNIVSLKCYIYFYTDNNKKKVLLKSSGYCYKYTLIKRCLITIDYVLKLYQNCQLGGPNVLTKMTNFYHAEFLSPLLYCIFQVK